MIRRTRTCCTSPRPVIPSSCAALCEQSDQQIALLPGRDARRNQCRRSSGPCRARSPRHTSRAARLRCATVNLRAQLNAYSEAVLAPASSGPYGRVAHFIIAFDTTCPRCRSGPLVAEDRRAFHRLVSSTVERRGGCNATARRRRIGLRIGLLRIAALRCRSPVARVTGSIGLLFRPRRTPQESPA